MQERFKCFNVNFRLLKTIYVHFLVCYLNKLENGRCKDKDIQKLLFQLDLAHQWMIQCLCHTMWLPCDSGLAHLMASLKVEQYNMGIKTY